MKPIRKPLALTVAAVFALSACSGGDGELLKPDGESSPSAASNEEAEAEPAAKPTLKLNVGHKNVAVDTLIKATVENGTPRSLRLLGAKGEAKGVKVKGSMTEAGWQASERLDPNSRYVLTGKAEDADGNVQTVNFEFSTARLSLDQQTYASVAPLDTAVVGIGQPVAVRFDVPVTDKASFEKHMTVTATPAQKGSWHWYSDYEARWRPANYWKPGTRIRVDVAVNGVSAGKGIYGQYDKAVNFRVSKVAKRVEVNLATKMLKAFENGKLVRSIPISAGKPGFTTRSGTKVIMSKHRYYDMNSTSIGIDPNSAEGYDLSDVEYAMRLTNSGEFFHAAPWNTGLFGAVNGSHGCTGLSTADAAWLYNFVDIGTPIEFSGSDRPMTLDNGFGDWNQSFAQYKTASAL